MRARRLLQRTVLLALTLIGIPTAVIAQTRSGAEQNQLILNGTMVRTQGASDLLGVLRRHVSGLRLALDAESPDNQPLVVMDGVALSGGVQRLVDMRPDVVVSVTVLRPRDAATRFGPKAQHGAIVVTTRSGPAPTPR